MALEIIRSIGAFKHCLETLSQLRQEMAEERFKRNTDNQILRYAIAAGFLPWNATLSDLEVRRCEVADAFEEVGLSIEKFTPRGYFDPDATSLGSQTFQES